MAAELAARPVDDRALALGLVPVAGEERGLAGAGQEAEVLGVGLRGDRQAGRRRRARAPRAWCARRAGSACAPASRAAAPRACTPGPWRGRPRCAAGRRACGARSGRSRGRRRRAARRARASRRAGRGRCSRRRGWASCRPRGRRGTARRHPRGTRRAGRREVRQAHAVRHGAGGADGARAAAGGLGVVVLVAPELERDADGLARSRPTSRAATAESTPPLIATSVRVRSGAIVGLRARRRAERAVQRVGGELGRVELARARARPARRRSRGSRAGRPSSSGAPSASAIAADPAAVAAAAARGVEARLGDPVALDPQRDPDEVPADGAARVPEWASWGVWPDGGGG